MDVRGHVEVLNPVERVAQPVRDAQLPVKLYPSVNIRGEESKESEEGETGEVVIPGCSHRRTRR